jgi:hypothetical protein
MPTIVTDASIAATPAEVWRVLTDFDAYEQWNPMMRSIRGRAEVGARLQLRFALRVGGRAYGAPARVFAAEPERELRWGGGVPGLLRIEHWVRLSPEGGGTRIEHGESFGGLLAGIGLKLIGLDEAPYRAMNQALKERVEAR